MMAVFMLPSPQQPRGIRGMSSYPKGRGEDGPLLSTGHGKPFPFVSSEIPWDTLVHIIIVPGIASILIPICVGQVT